MNRDDISTLAEAAGLNYTVDLQHDGKHHIRLDGWPENFEHFAQLVAAHEREECAKLCEARVMGDHNREDAEAQRCADALRARGTA